jgi:uncharacterized protein (TIGR02722 family)
MKTRCAWTNGLLLAALIPLLSGCAAFRAKTTEVDPTVTRHLGAGYDYSDMRKITESVAAEIIESPFLADQAEAPVMMIAGVQNRTSGHEDMKNLTDRLRTLLFQTGKLRFINEARRDDLLREQGYQAAQATPETQAAVGRQLGAKYMLTGSLTQMKDETPRQVRVSKTKVNYYKLCVEITALQSGEIAWLTEKEFAREARLPLIGW